MSFVFGPPDAAVLLFDIDGTLLRGHGAGRRLMEEAFVEVLAPLGVSAASLEAVPFHGNTDPAIVAAGLTALGLEAEEVRVGAIIERYLARLEREVAESNPFVALDGAVELCAALAARGYSLGLGTGNVEAAAWLKVRAIGLGGVFAYGGFASDHHERAELLRIGWQRGASRLGRAPEGCAVVVIGDTTRDIAAARAIGAEVVAVATGGDEAEVLAAHRPTALVSTLRACLAMLA